MLQDYGWFGGNSNGQTHPVGQKELNGCVERKHRIDDVEFYSFHQAQSHDELNLMLKRYVEEHNDSRRYKPLGWRSPNQWLREQTKFNLIENLTDESYEMAA